MINTDDYNYNDSSHHYQSFALATPPVSPAQNQKTIAVIYHDNHFTLIIINIITTVISVFISVDIFLCGNSLPIT